MFGVTTEGTIYSFGFTLLTGVFMNFIMGVTASRLMTASLSKFKLFKNKKLYGGVTND
jgi:preprotein translocase subunit SecD/SecD/SecF fusion protein